jgi:hypothetical protein
MKSARWSPALALFIVLMMPTAGIGSGPWLPVQRSEILRLLAGDADIESLKVLPLDEWLGVLRSAINPKTRDIDRLEAMKIELAKVLGPGEIVWVSTKEDALLGIVMAGRDENIHSLRLVVPVVNYSQDQSDHIFRTLSALFTASFPAWSDAAEWPIRSLHESWNRSPLVRDEPLSDPDDLVVRKHVDGVRNATFGVPPDIVVYTMTMRDHCVPSISKGNPFERLIC